MQGHENVAAVSVSQRRPSLPIHMNDQELSDLFAACMPSLKKAAMRMLRNPQDSEDVLQEGLLSAVKNLHQFEGRSSFSTWLHSIVRNASRMYYRKNASARMGPANPASMDSCEFFETDYVADQRPSPEELAIRQERSDILQSVVRELPPKQQAAIESFYLLELGERESSKHLGVTESSLKAQLHRSRRILTRRIRQAYLAGFRSNLLKAQPVFQINTARRRSGRIKTVASKSSNRALSLSR